MEEWMGYYKEVAISYGWVVARKEIFSTEVYLWWLPKTEAQIFSPGLEDIKFWNFKKVGQWDLAFFINNPQGCFLNIFNFLVASIERPGCQTGQVYLTKGRTKEIYYFNNWDGGQLNLFRRFRRKSDKFA